VNLHHPVSDARSVLAETGLVGNDPTYDSMRSISSFKFDSSYVLNTTMMGEKISYPVGDPNGAGI